MRPSTAASNVRGSHGGSAAPTSSGTGVRWRPQSASVDGRASPAVKPPSNNNKTNASSDELIRDLENKVRKVVEQKRADSDKLRFAVAKKRDDVNKAKLILQDLLKDSGALGLHYDLRDGTLKGGGAAAAGGGLNTEAKLPENNDDASRLQPIASISRRPVYSKHTNIHELEAKLDRRAKEAQLVHRRTLVLEHIKKRLLHERVEVAQSTNQLKQVYADLTHEAQELQKRDIAAAEAVSHVQTRIVQQKADMAASVRKFKRELALRHKWAREKAKFEKYYNDQLQAAMMKAASVGAGSYNADSPLHSPSQRHAHADTASSGGHVLKRGGGGGGGGSPPSILKHRRSSLQQSLAEKVHEDAEETRYREAFQRIGVAPHVAAIDPEEIIRICLSHEELQNELDTKHDESVERIAQLREQINKARSAAREDVPLSKRGTSQKIETKQLEIFSVERQLATVVDQYMFVENAVRPIKIGLQQVLQNMSSATVNVDNMTALEKCLVESCEEMMRVLRASSTPSPEADISNQDPSNDAYPCDESTARHNSTIDPEQGATPAVVSLESFTSPYNIRIAAKKRDKYFVPGLTKAPAAAAAVKDDDEYEENDFEVMDRAMVKRISSVVLCTSVGKKSKEATAQDDTTTAHHSHSHVHKHSHHHRR